MYRYIYNVKITTNVKIQSLLGSGNENLIICLILVTFFMLLSLIFAFIDHLTEHYFLTWLISPNRRYHFYPYVIFIILTIKYVLGENLLDHSQLVISYPFLFPSNIMRQEEKKNEVVKPVLNHFFERSNRFSPFF